MDFLRELKMPNLVYGLMILLTISLFFFSGRNDNVYNAITQQKNDTHNALEGIIHENNEKNIIKHTKNVNNFIFIILIYLFFKS